MQTSPDFSLIFSERTPFGGAEESFEIQIVSGQNGIVFAHEESGMEALHGLGPMLSDRVFVRLKGLLKGEEGCFARVG